MDYLKNFVIPLSGLKTGKHHFNFRVDNRFFEQFHHSEILEGDIKVDCLLEKQTRMMIFNFTLKGLVRITCDRCADDFEHPIEGKQKHIVKYGQDHVEESDEILIITEKEHEVSIGQLLYEYIHLMLPIKKVHPDDANGKSLCNPDVVRYIVEAEDRVSDPRWEKLQQLLEKSDENDN